MAAGRSNPVRSMLDEGQTRPRRRFQLIGDVYSELSKVTWPSREDAVRLTLLVLAVAITVGVFLGIWDYAFSQLFERLFL